jgi:hypothetical protein
LEHSMHAVTAFYMITFMGPAPRRDQLRAPGFPVWGLLARTHQAIYAMRVVRTLVPRRYGPSRPRLLTTLKNCRTRAPAEASAVQNRRSTIPGCPAQPSDLYPRALRFPTDKRRVFHLSATIAFNWSAV